MSMAASPQATPARPARVLPVIVLAQFAGTSLWFAANAVMPDLMRAWALPASAVGTLTSAVQFGFIAGTFVFALLAVADRWSPRWVFLMCSLLGAGCNAAGAWATSSLEGLLVWRFLTGFFLAGIYPVGMKIAASWYPQGLGAALGWLIGALVLGSASPHLLRGLGAEWPWQEVMGAVSLLAVAGGVAVVRLVPDGPHLPKGGGLQFRALAAMWTDRKVRASVLGYFGHMWELYTLWVLVPAIVATRLSGPAVSLASFAVMAVGMFGCIGGGLAVRRFGSARVAGLQLGLSGLCCLLAPLMLAAPDALFALWLLVWGITVAGDSPQFSTLTAMNAPREAVGSVLTLSNSIGFGISIASIQLFSLLAERHALEVLLPWLAVGPLLGLMALRPLIRAH
jgi:MFS transporter, DHA1 family, inner membrane transport protein